MRTVTLRRHKTSPDSEIASGSTPIPPASKNAAELPGELIEHILAYLRNDANSLSGPSSFDRSLSSCSLVCRHWAANIRPGIFKDVRLKSQLDAKRFNTAVSSPCKVPAPLNILVKRLDLDVDEDARPWMYFVLAPIRDGLLPNLERIVLTVSTKKSDLRTSQPSRRKRHSLYDLGLPRTMPSQAVRSLRLPGLVLDNIMFPSPKAFVRYLTSFTSNDIRCHSLQWPDRDAAPVPVALYSLSGRLFAQTHVYIRECTAVLPFMQVTVTTHPPSPHAPQEQVYISPEQIDTFTGIISLFTDDAEWWLGVSHSRYHLWAYPGAP